MPDFERLHRSLAIHVAGHRNPDRIPIIEAEFRGEDRARWQIAKLVAVIATLVISAAWFVGR